MSGSGLVWVGFGGWWGGGGRAWGPWTGGWGEREGRGDLGQVGTKQRATDTGRTGDAAKDEGGGLDAVAVHLAVHVGRGPLCQRPCRELRGKEGGEGGRREGAPYQR